MVTGRVLFLRHYFDVFIVFLNSLPRLVLIPFFIILFGFGHAPGIIVTALIVILVIAAIAAGGVIATKIGNNAAAVPEP